ncbi:MAG TPA: DUF3017 domain-containing protein [Actinomycetales bacterium]|nr:DUF3017 domain-containing protein [Actinomycetales bacterium]
MTDGPAGQGGSAPVSSPSAPPRPVMPRLIGPWLLLAVGVLVAVVAVLLDHVRLGGYLLAAALGLAGLLRAFLPSSLVGAVAARSRTTDVVLLLGAAAACAVLASTLNLAGS